MASQLHRHRARRLDHCCVHSILKGWECAPLQNETLVSIVGNQSLMSSLCLERRHVDSLAADGHCKKGSAYPKQCVLYISLRHGATVASLRAIFIRNQETASQRSPALDNVAVETAGNHISHNRLLKSSLMLWKLFYLLSFRSF